jgi:hypothetical protein
MCPIAGSDLFYLQEFNVVGQKFFGSCISVRYREACFGLLGVAASVSE